MTNPHGGGQGCEGTGAECMAEGGWLELANVTRCPSLPAAPRPRSPTEPDTVDTEWLTVLITAWLSGHHSPHVLRAEEP